MNYIYLGLGDLYLPAVAAAIHLGRLRDGLPEQEFMEIPHFRHGKSEDNGLLHHAGKDEDGNHIWLACVNAQPEMIRRAVMSLLAIYGRDMTEVQVRPCVPENPQVTGICSLLNRLGLTGLEKRVARRLAKNRYSDMKRIAGVQPAEGSPDK
jgi:hypothetical protein